jgi:hypothetical protein
MAVEITGFLHVMRVPARVDPVNAEYRIVYRLRGRRVSCLGLDALTDFLRRAGVPIPEIERAWQTLVRRRVHSIPRVVLTPAQLEALRL